MQRLTGKCLCALSKEKSSSNFQPFQFGVACKVGAEKVIHSLRNCVEVNWQSGDVVILKVDMSNAFNFVSRQTVLEECATFFPELTPWVTWCYGSHTSSFHPQGRIWSQSGAHQVTPLVLCSSPWCCTNWCPA